MNEVIYHNIKKNSQEPLQIYLEFHSYNRYEFSLFSYSIGQVFCQKQRIKQKHNVNLGFDSLRKCFLIPQNTYQVLTQSQDLDIYQGKRWMTSAWHNTGTLYRLCDRALESDTSKALPHGPYIVAKQVIHTDYATWTQRHSIGDYAICIQDIV